MTTTSQALATTEQGPTSLVRRYAGDFAAVLPSHIKADTWNRLAVGALRRDAKLREAAESDPPSLMVALLHAARLGLEPGTESYYLTPRKEKGRLKVLGIPGYQGLVELMYRAGAVSSVIVEVVYEADRFTYAPGRDERPIHEIDWDLDDRGALRLAYAYAVMKGGATSRVVVLNRRRITEIKAKSQGADGAYSPWQTNPEAMWLKSAARQLAKWVPTSPEWLTAQLRAVQSAQHEPAAEPVGDLPEPPIGVDDSTGEIVDAELLDSENGES